jgi:hypothetical protein
VGKSKIRKLKKWGARSHRHAERAEAAAERAEAALRRIAVVTGHAMGRGVPSNGTGGLADDPVGTDRRKPADRERQDQYHPAYTRPRGEDAALADIDGEHRLSERGE